MDKDNQLTAWGGRDTWRYVWEPEVEATPQDTADDEDIMAVNPTKFLEFFQNSSDSVETKIEIKNISSDRIVYKVDILYSGYSQSSGEW